MSEMNQPAEGTKLFVGGISWGTTSDSLRDAFAQFGEVVEAVVITDRETGRSKGFGFVTFSTPEEAEAAVAGMNEKELDGRSITVNVARPREDRGPRNDR